jgi:anti-sigma factor RsiW
MKHRRIIKEVSAFIDGELDEATQAELRKHVAACPRCRIYVDTVRKTITLYQAQEARKKAPAAMQKRLYAKIAIKLKERKS